MLSRGNSVPNVVSKGNSFMGNLAKLKVKLDKNKEVCDEKNIMIDKL
jgi:D-arabinose 5-phosphate isomerase GutQ